ncbi:MAG: restriction endonuclease, partial [Alphaproteobacteria bacterium]|nr:restriction endonuclease [Alphaproteobacteria bacterium]
MALTNAVGGALFARDFLENSVEGMPEWKALDEAELDGLAADLRAIFSGFPVSGAPNEAQTEDDLIWPVLERIGWTDHLRSQPLTRRMTPDGLLFPDAAAKAQANKAHDPAARYGLGAALAELKRWQAPLDRRDAGEATPATQLLGYLDRAAIATEGKLRWGILTNGKLWRLYWSGAQSMSEQFFEIDLAATLGVTGLDDGLFGAAAANGEREKAERRLLRLFFLVFRREAFLPGPEGWDTFHSRAIDEGRRYEAKLAGDLSGLVFDEVFPRLAQAVAREAPETPLPEIRNAALVLLYRLMFLLYAEDRGLLPVADSRYSPFALHGLREKVREQKTAGAQFSTRAANYWGDIDELCRAIDEGDDSVGLPPYDGGLFEAGQTPLLGSIRLRNKDVADIIDRLCFQNVAGDRRYINFRDLSVQQLGSIYERLLEYELAREEDGGVAVRPGMFARKLSGSYYTPDDLVGLIVRETVGPLAEARRDAFREAAEAGARPAELRRLDPAERLLELKICDPAMGSGHFLVNLADWLADRVLVEMAEAAALAEDYVSPLAARIEEVRSTVLANAKEHEWQVDRARLDDRHIVKRMVLKRCIYGVDKNPMAVELAKVSLWLHSFTVGAPLSFLDHHLRCGDSLFGLSVRAGMDRAEAHGAGPLLNAPAQAVAQAAHGVRAVEALADAELAEARQSAEQWADAEAKTRPLDRFLSVVHAFDWLNIRDSEDKAALHAFFDGQFGDPLKIAQDATVPDPDAPEVERFAALLERARALAAEERFLNWQVSFPGVWEHLANDRPDGGFDAVIGNPPWERMNIEEVEWLKVRRPELAHMPRAADREQAINKLREAGDSLPVAYDAARERTAIAARLVRKGGNYPLLSAGRINFYSLFVERAMALAKPDGMVGLLVPSDIASDMTAARFFRGVATEGRLKAFYDFENRKVFFPDVDSRFKFCVFVASPSPVGTATQYAVFLHDTAALADDDRRFPLTARDFARVNPNTGTAPIFRSRRDAELTTAIYSRLPILVNRSRDRERKVWPVKYMQMLNMTTDSDLFRTRAELEEKEGAWPVGGNRFDSPSGEWVPLYVGRMIHQFDHRAASVKMNEENLHNPALSSNISAKQKADPSFLPTPQYWIPTNAVSFPDGIDWTLAFRDIARTTDARTMIASAVPLVGLGNKVPAVFVEDYKDDHSNAAVLLARPCGRIDSGIGFGIPGR